MNETAINGYMGTADLPSCSLTDLEHLWDAVPTEHQEQIKRRYHQTLHTKGIRDDAGELRLIEDYLHRFEQEGLIPAGERWLRLSASAREALRSDTTDWQTRDDGEIAPRSRLLVIGAVVFAVILVGLLVMRLGGSDEGSTALVMAVTSTASPSPTPTNIPTATPLALVDTDRFVGESDRRSNRDFYPVVFRIVPPDETPPRVFVVQERLVGTTEWRYEANPDVASWVGGMLVHPVIGIPYSDTNRHLFESLETGTTLVLRMNTGAELRFGYEELVQVAREDTSIFSQLTPGIAVLLIGQTGEDGLPTAARHMVLGHYLPAQELDLLRDAPVQIPVGFASPAAVGDLSVTVSRVTRESTGDASALHVGLLVGTDMEATSTSGHSWFVEDEHGVQYAARTSAIPATLVPGAVQPVEMMFDVPAASETMQLVVVSPSGESISFALPLNGVSPSAGLEALDVQMRGVSRDARTLYVDVRLFNPTDETHTLTEVDVWCITGYVPDPSGPQQKPLDFTPLEIAPGDAWDVTLQFPWNGRDPYASVSIAGRRYAVVVSD